ncbi:MAG: hypothetical protein FJ308_21885 [Planctomycetes bacterium]|nr:hypothetical protein [Planctomycetota bacterium]
MGRNRLVHALGSQAWFSSVCDLSHRRWDLDPPLPTLTRGGFMQTHSSITASSSNEVAPFKDRKHRERSFLWPVLLASWIVSFSIAWTHDTIEIQDESPLFGITDPETQSFLAPFRKAAKEWEKDVEKLSATNATAGSKDTVVCLGSSSFRIWDTIDNDMAPYRMVRRAYGSARYRDLAIYTPKLIHNFTFNKAMVFVGNDIVGKELDVTPETVGKLARIVVSSILREQPTATIYLIAVTPTPSRFKLWDKIQQVNQQLEQIASEQSQVRFVPTANSFIGEDGQPIEGYFTTDKLHLNEDGYKVWAEILKKHLGEP